MCLIRVAGEIAAAGGRSAVDDTKSRIEIGAMDTRNTNLQADVLIIGWGKGGKAAAAGLGKLGKRVVLVEQSERMYGGTCPNVGCVPSKGLVHRSGKRRPTDPPQEFYERAVREVQAIRESMRIGNYEELNSLDTVTIVIGRAAFIRYPNHKAHLARNQRRRTSPPTRDTPLALVGRRLPRVSGARAARSVPRSLGTLAEAGGAASPWARATKIARPDGRRDRAARHSTISRCVVGR
jgi:choline dehydrogenase-like flavoprotein